MLCKVAPVLNEGGWVATYGIFSFLIWIYFFYSLILVTQTPNPRDGKGGLIARLYKRRETGPILLTVIYTHNYYLALGWFHTTF